MTARDIKRKTVEKMHLLEDGAISNAKAERLALMMAEEVHPKSRAYVICFRRPGSKNVPSGQYGAQVMASPAFKARLETLMKEKADLMAEGELGELKWMARQNYRRAVAWDEPAKAIAATELLYKLYREGKPKLPPPEADGAEEAESSRGRGAPLAPNPVPEDVVPDYRRNALLER